MSLRQELKGVLSRFGPKPGSDELEHFAKEPIKIGVVESVGRSLEISVVRRADDPDLFFIGTVVNTRFTQRVTLNHLNKLGLRSTLGAGTKPNSATILQVIQETIDVTRDELEDQPLIDDVSNFMTYVIRYCVSQLPRLGITQIEMKTHAGSSLYSTLQESGFIHIREEDKFLLLGMSGFEREDFERYGQRPILMRYYASPIDRVHQKIRNLLFRESEDNFSPTP